MLKSTICAVLGAAAAAAAVVFSGGTAYAAAPDCSTARLIVPWGPGGGTAVIFGIFEKAIDDSDAAVKIKVVTIPGQGGGAGAKEAHAAAPDGCTLFAIHQHLVVNYINGVTDFSWNGFEPVALLTDTPEIIGAGGHVPYNTLDEMLDAARDAPGQIPTGVSMGATSHFLFIMLGAKTGTDYAYVPFQGGTAGRITGLLSAAIDLGGINMAAARTQRQDGALKAFAIAADERSPLIPDVPTLKELGVDMTYSLTRGVMLPKGTPQEYVDYWAEVFKGPTEDDAFIAAQAAKGTSIVYLGPEDYAAWWKETEVDFLESAKSLKVGRFQ